ncbi:MAG: hypothetical protein GXP46_03955 [Deferribacteres bacterium]|nr:hypothetical protein [Deferribacteres bacterium]
MTDRQKIVILYNDTASSVNKVIGVELSRDSQFILIQSTTLGKVQIPLAKVVRIQEAEA